MKKVVIALATVIVMAGIVYGCKCAYDYFTTTKPIDEPPIITDNNKTGGEISKDSGENEPSIQETPIFTKDTYPNVDASTAIQPLAEALKENFIGKDAEDMETEYLDTHYGFLGVVDGTRDICFMSYPSDEEMAYAKEKGVELEIIKATNSAFCFIVNSENPVNNLTMQQIRDIYSGKITNWKEVGGDDAKIIPYQRPVNSGSQSGMLQLVMKGQKMMEPPTITLSLEMGEMVDAIAAYDNGKSSIGYSYYYYINTMYKRDTIKILNVDGIPANKESIKAGEYPIMTSGWFVIRKNEVADSSTRKWIEAYQSERGAKIAEDMGYIPAK